MVRDPQWPLYSCRFHFFRQFATQSPMPTQRSCPFLKGLVAIPVGSWSPSVIQYCASAHTDCGSTSASTAAAHTLTVVAQEGQRGGVRLDFCVRGYTNRESLISFSTGRILFQSLCPSKKASWCLTLIGARYLGQDFRIIQRYFSHVSRAFINFFQKYAMTSHRTRMHDHP